jgi:hypothetical protein
MERTHCVICLSEISLSFCLNDFPKTFLPTLENIESDKFINLDLYGCKNCGCVQLKHLLDPNELYGIAHNITYNTPMWKEHHRLLCNFVYDNIESNNKKIIEIGGYSVVLANLVKQKDSSIDYTILDLCDVNPNIENVKFINGNCETFDFNKDASIVMSHIFEHLYEPIKFINNMKQNSIENVFISIPNMKAQIKNNCIPIVHQEHTFFCDYDNIIYLFSKGGYLCKSSYFYKEHSIFFHFVNSSDIKIDNTYFDVKRIENLTNVYEFTKNKIKDILINNNENIFIVPAGLYGQIIYYFLNDIYKKNIIGFLDNDPSKIGKRLYGTKNYIFKMDEIKNYDNVTLLIYKGPYMEEMMNQLNSYNKNIKYIIV